MQPTFPPVPENMDSYANLFSYAVWTPNASVGLCNVPWDSSYRDVARFPTQAAKTAYFAALAANGASVNLMKLTVLKYGEPIYLNLPFNVVNGFNYIVVTQPNLPVPFADNTARTKFYYFIQNVEYIAPNTTKLNVQLDVWQTYYEDVTFNRCYIERGHVGIANSNSTDQNTADYLTIPEGLEYGNEYITVNQQYKNLLSVAPMVVVVSTADLTADFGTMAEPNLKTATGGVYDNMPNGANIYALTGGSFLTLMNVLSDFPWISQCITMLTVIPDDMLDLVTSVEIAGVPAYELNGSETADDDYIVVSNLMEKFEIPTRYANLHKLKTAPYSVVEMSTMTGGEIVLKPECIRLTTGAASFAMLSCVSPPHIRAYFYPQGYNGVLGTHVDITYRSIKNVAKTATVGTGEFIDLAVQIGNFPQFSLVNNAYQQYLASTAHTRQYQFDTADWSYSKAGKSANLSAEQASKGIDTTMQNVQAGIGAQNARLRIQQMQTLANAGTGLATGAAGGALAGGGIGAAVGMAGSVAGIAVSMAANEANNNISVGLANTQAYNSQNAALFNKDSNLQYAVFANQGDYQNQIQSINARVQDAKLTQPSTSGQNGGEAFNLSNGLWGVRFKFKRIKDQYIRTIGEYWLRFGYYVNLFLVPPATLHCCEKFTYWKMLEVYITAENVPEMYKESIRGIFEKGVTVWANPSDIGQTDVADNEPLTEVSY